MIVQTVRGRIDWKRPLSFFDIPDEDRKIKAQKFKTAFYAKPDLRKVEERENRRKAEEKTAIDAGDLLGLLKQSPELLAAIASLINS